jgi:E3 ubiquitin-protein ligase HUWE1
MQFDEGDDLDDGTGSQPLTDDDEDDDMGEGENEWVSPNVV